MPLLFAFPPKNPCASYLSFAQRLGTRRGTLQAFFVFFSIKKAQEEVKQLPLNLGFSLTPPKTLALGALSADTSGKKGRNYFRDPTVKDKGGKTTIRTTGRIISGFGELRRAFGVPPDGLSPPAASVQELSGRLLC